MSKERDAIQIIFDVLVNLISRANIYNEYCKNRLNELAQLLDDWEQEKEDG